MDQLEVGFKNPSETNFGIIKARIDHQTSNQNFGSKSTF